MTAALIISILILAAMTFMAASSFSRSKALTGEVAYLRRANDQLRQQIDAMGRESTSLLMEVAYRDGVECGRQTDEVYKALLRKREQGQQVSVHAAGTGRRYPGTNVINGGFGGAHG